MADEFIQALEGVRAKRPPREGVAHWALRWMRTAAGFWNDRVPGQLIVQITDHCNAGCPQCGMRRSADFARSRLPKEQVFRIVDRAAEQKIYALSLTGGEPMLFLDDVVDVLNHAGRRGIKYLRTGTNGFVFSDPDSARFVEKVTGLAEKLASGPVRNFWISIDSAVPEVHEAMATFYDRVIDLGFTMTSACYPMSIDEDGEGLSAAYTATSTEEIVRFSAAEKAVLFRELARVIQKYRSKIRIFTPLCTLHELARQHGAGIAPKHGCREGVISSSSTARMGMCILAGTGGT